MLLVNCLPKVKLATDFPTESQYCWSTLAFNGKSEFNPSQSYLQPPVSVMDSKHWWKHELLPLGDILVSAEHKSFQIRCMFEYYTWTHILHFAHYCLHQLYSKQEWKKGVSVPALLSVIKIHKCHHVTVWHHCCTAHNVNSDLGIALATCYYSTNWLSWHYYIEKCGLPSFTDALYKDFV